MMVGNEVITDDIYARTVAIEERLDYRPRETQRFADNDNLILIQDLNRHGTKDESGRHWTPTAKDSKEASVNLVRQWLKEDRIEISPECRMLIGTLETSLWNNTRTDFARSKVFGHADALASLIYLIRNLNVHTNPIPMTFGADIDNVFIRNGTRQEDSAQVLSDAFGLKARK